MLSDASDRIGISTWPLIQTGNNLYPSKSRRNCYASFMVTKKPASVEYIGERILLVRGIKVMLDADLAELYEVETRVLNQAVKRNRDRFPADFMFSLTDQEVSNWRSQIVMSNFGARRGAAHALRIRLFERIAAPITSGSCGRQRLRPQRWA